MLFSAFKHRVAVVLAPHADDEILGAGGFISKARAAGWEIDLLFATVSGYGSLQRAEHSAYESRLAEVQRAMKVSGARSFVVFNPPDGRAPPHLKLDCVPQIELITFIEAYLKASRPSIAVIPYRGHYHQDHRAFADAALTALRPAPDNILPFVPVVLAYGHAASGWAATPEFKPTFFIDITEVMDTKLRALACYESQLCEPPHPRSLEAVRHNAAAWGAYAGTRYAEPYECLRCVWQ
jgi:LmbE family N-acetylglucosaminyl deacetylase